MDSLNSYGPIIEQCLLPYTTIPYAYGQVQCRPVFDRERQSFLLITEGWQGAKRIHGCLVHIDIIAGKVWIQRDDTDGGIAYTLVEAGIPKEQIVLGFQEPRVRPYTDYAVA
jgi:XisI protein